LTRTYIQHLPIPLTAYIANAQAPIWTSFNPWKSSIISKWTPIEFNKSSSSDSLLSAQKSCRTSSISTAFTTWPCTRNLGWGTRIKFREFTSRLLWPWKYAKHSKPFRGALEESNKHNKIIFVLASHQSLQIRKCLWGFCDIHQSKGGGGGVFCSHCVLIKFSRGFHPVPQVFTKTSLIGGKFYLILFGSSSTSMYTNCTSKERCISTLFILAYLGFYVGECPMFRGVYPM
jgi:hypothetical protein